VVLDGVPEKPSCRRPHCHRPHQSRHRQAGRALRSERHARILYEGTSESSTDVLEGGTAPAPEGVREGLF